MREIHHSILTSLLTYEKTKLLSDYMIDNLGSIFMLVDESGLIYRVNLETAKLLKISIEKIAGAKLQEFFSPVDSQLIFAQIQNLIKYKSQKTQFEVDLKSKNLLIEIQKIHIIPYYNIFAIIGTDITQFKSVVKEKNLVESELLNEKKQTLRLKALEVFNEMKVELGFTSEFQKLAKIWSELFGFEGMCFLQFSSNDQVFQEKSIYGNWLYSMDQKQFRSLMDAQAVSWVKEKDGMNVISMPIFFHQIPLGLLFCRTKKELNISWIEIFGELSQRFSIFLNQLEMQIEIAEKNFQLENASKLAAIGELSGGIAHEINNPLTVIYGKVRLVMNLVKSGQGTKDQMLNHLEALIKTVDRVTNVVKNLKVFAKETNREELKPIAIESIIENTLLLFEERLSSNGIKLNFTKSNSHLFVLGNESQLSQVILNIINNAFDAIMSLSDRWISIEVFDLNENQLKVEITDSGHGIPIEIAKKIMQPFFTTKDIGKGTGLGLSISYGIVKNHGGELYLNRAHHHTQFVIQLPKTKLGA